MKLEVFVQDSGTEVIYDISTLCNRIQYETFLNGQPGKLTLLIQKDPNNVLRLTNGSIVRFIVNGYKTFLGYIFTMGNKTVTINLDKNVQICTEV